MSVGAPGARNPRGGASWLGRRSPVVLLAVLVGISITTLLLLDPVTLAALYVVLLAGVLAAARIAPGALVRAQLPFVAVAAGVVVVNALSRPGEALWPGLPVRVTVEGVRIGAALALRTLVIGLGAVALAHVTDPRRLLVSLIRHARVSPRYAYALLAGHRLLDDLPAQWRTLTRARLVRRPGASRGRGRLTLRELASCAFALLVGSIRAAERIALALESRGLASGPRTLWRPVPLTWRDGVLVVVVALAIAGVIAGRALLAR